MNNVETRTDSVMIPVEDCQRRVAEMAKENAELIAVAAMAFVNGLQIGSVRAAAEQQ